MIDILSIRDALNEQPFRNGRRQVFIGRISDQVPMAEPEEEGDEEVNENEAKPKHRRVIIDTPMVLDYLSQVQSALAKYDLKMVRDSEDRDGLYAVQELKQQTDVDLSWMGNASEWVGRIVGVGLLMIGPGLLGLWLDDRMETRYWGPIGGILGFALGLLYLFGLSRIKPSSP